MSEINMIRSICMVGTNFLEIQSQYALVHTLIEGGADITNTVLSLDEWKCVMNEPMGMSKIENIWLWFWRRKCSHFKSSKYCGLSGCHHDQHTIFLVESHCLDFHFWIISRTCLWSSQSLDAHRIVFKPLKSSIPEKSRVGSGEIAEAGFACLVWNLTWQSNTG